MCVRDALMAACVSSLGLLMCGTEVAAQTPWERQSPWPYPPGSFEGVHMTTPDHFFAVSSGMGAFEDALHESTDGGATWVARELNMGWDPSYREVWFWDENLGFILGNGSASNLRTTDGGATWEVMADNFSPYSWYGIKLLDGQFGYAHGNGSPAFTQDGGITWAHPELEGDPPDPYFAFQRVGGFTSDFSVGLGAGDMGVWRTTNRGLFWELVLADEDVTGIVMMDDQVALAFRSDSVLRTVDQGDTWVPIPLPASGMWIPFKFSASVVLAQHWNGTTIRSADAGLTWTLLPNLYSHPFDFEQVDEQTGILLQLMGYGGNPVLLRTEDAGATWTGVSPEGTPVLWSVDMLDGQNGIAAGFDNARLVTRNGGATWAHIDEGSVGYVNDVLMLDGNRGFAVGQGRILRTDNRGETWVRDEVVDELFDIDRVPSGELVAVGQSGHYRTSSDDGETWTERRLFARDIVRLNFEDALEGWLTTGMGSYGYAYRTRDGGQTWEEKFGPTGATMWAIDFGATETYGLIGGGFEGLFRTIDGGESWFHINTVNDHEIYCIHFTDHNSVWVAGSYGYLAHSDDAGIYWEVFDTGIQNAITAMDVVDENTIYAVATGGITLHTLDGGETWVIEDVQNETPGWNAFLGVDAVESGEVFAVGEFGAIYRRTLEDSASAELTDVAVAWGTLISGDLEDVRTSDDSRLGARSRYGFTQAGSHLLDVRVGAVTGPGAAQSLDLTVEARVNFGSAATRLRLLNWNTGAFDDVHQYPIGTTETIEAIGGLSAGNRVRSSDGRIELSLRATMMATFSAQGFDLMVDHVSIMVAE